MYKLKLKAILYRLIISIILILTIIFPLYHLWYPYPLNIALNIDLMIFVILVVNCITVIVLMVIFYNPTRKDNKKNMLVIYVIQIVAFLIGFYYFVQVRPAWLIQHERKIYVIQPIFAIFPDYMNFYEKLKAQSWGRPVFKTVYFSENKNQQQIQLSQSVEGRGIEYQPLEYRQFNEKFAKKYSSSVSALSEFNEKRDLDVVFSSFSKEKILWLPLRSSVNGKDMVVLLDPNGKIIGITLLNPW